MPTALVETPAQVVTGPAGTVARLRPRAFTREVPIAKTPYQQVVDVWRMPGGMYAVIMRGDTDEHAFLLCYVDSDVLDLALKMGFHESLAVDVWLFLQVPCVVDDVEARNVMRHVAMCAANGVVPFEPITPEARVLWKAAVTSLAAVTTRRPL